MYAITMNNLYWNATSQSFTTVPTRYESEGEAAEAAQEDAKLPPESPWAVVKV